ncbi:IS3 family transposase [Streptomyces sp. NPDC005761]|uniref:IS3 family transposase n=1 Tax=Streptomyces sp. NPDC005761 TaxID=3157066 RepID=UPI0033EE685B
MINHLRDDFGVEPVCRELDLSVSAHNAHNARRRRPKSARRWRDDHLIAEIRRIHTGSGETYGARRIHRQLRREGLTAARCTVERLIEAGATASVGSAADSYDNAMAEALNGSFKAELIEHHGPLARR